MLISSKVSLLKELLASLKRSLHALDNVHMVDDPTVEDAKCTLREKLADVKSNLKMMGKKAA